MRGRFSLIAFDLDGTLVDSRRDLADAANIVLQEHGGRPHSEEAIARMVGDGAATLVARAFTAAQIAQPVDALERFLEVYNRRLLNHTKPYEGVVELIAALRSRAALAVLTNKPIGATLTILDAFGLLEPFEGRVLGGDGPQPRKPDPAGLELLMARAAAPAGRTLLVGDSVVDFRTAVSAGAAACLVRWGFGLHGVDERELRSGDFTINTPAELLARL